MTITALAQETISDHLISTLDPAVYDAETIAEDIAVLVADAEAVAWERAYRDIKGLVNDDTLTAEAVAHIINRYGLDPA